MAEAQATENPDEISLKTEERVSLKTGEKGQMKEDGTYYQAFGGTELMTKALTERVDNRELPLVHLVDMRREAEKRKKVITTKRKNQIIITVKKRSTLLKKRIQGLKNPSYGRTQ